MLNINWLSSVTELLLVFIITSVFVLYFKYRQIYKYWKQLGVEQLNPTFPTGDLSTAGLGITSIFVRMKILYDQIKQKGLKYGGIYYFNGPVFLPVSPDLIKRIMITDFNHFVDRGVYIDEENLPISGHLFSMTGQRWKDLRMKLTPLFTSGKLKNIYNIMIGNVENLIQILKETDGQQFDIKQTLSRLTIDMIGNVAFGIDCNSLKYPDDKFSQMAMKIFNAPIWELFKLIIQEGLQNPGNIVKTVHTNEYVVKYFTDLVHGIVQYRDKNRMIRDDFMQLLLKLRDTSGLSMNEIVAQCYLFFLAGYETSSSTMSFAIHEMAYNQDIQENVRDEIVKNVGSDVTKFDYEAISKLPLLDKIMKETMRKYPSVPLLHRIVVKPYKIPDSEVVLEVGTPVIISVIGLHRDSEYFPDPMKFDPERFNNDNSNNVAPFTYLPFGDGPRNCIGMRMGVMQVKLGLAAMLSNFRFYPGEHSQRELSISPSTTSPTLTVKGGIPIKVVRI